MATDELKWIPTRYPNEKHPMFYTLRREYKVIGGCIWDGVLKRWEFHEYKNEDGVPLDAEDPANPPLDLCMNLAILKGDEV